MPSNVTCWLSMGKVEQLLLFLSLSWGGECCRDADGSTLGYTVSMCTAEAQTSCPNFQPSPSSMSCPWSGAGDNSVIHDPSNGTLQDGTGIIFRLEFSALSLNPGFGTLPKAPVSTGNGKEGMTHLSPFLQNNPSHRLQGGWLQLDPSFSDKSGQVAQVNVVFQWAQLLLDFFFFFGNFKEEFWPQEEPMCSPPPSMLLFLDGGTKITTEGYHESCRRGCCAVFQEICFKMFNVS